MQFILCASKSAMSVHHAEGEESAKKLLCNMVLKDSSLEGPGGGGGNWCSKTRTTLPGVTNTVRQ